MSERMTFRDQKSDDARWIEWKGLEADATLAQHIGHVVFQKSGATVQCVPENGEMYFGFRDSEL